MKRVLARMSEGNSYLEEAGIDGRKILKPVCTE
jgi:hypothetical protein